MIKLAFLILSRAFLITKIKFNDGLVSKISKAPSTTSFYLNQLIQDNIIGTRKSDFVKRYYNIEKKRIANLIEEYHPDVIEQSSDNLADIIASL